MERLTKIMGNGLACLVDGEYPGDIAIEALQRLSAYEDTKLTPEDIQTIRNELCLMCGKYKDTHTGACDGCRWKKED